jgi:hypothetical protein
VPVPRISISVAPGIPSAACTRTSRTWFCAPAAQAMELVKMTAAAAPSFSTTFFRRTSFERGFRMSAPMRSKRY